MENAAFSLARNAMTSLEMYRDYYASSEPYQKNFQEVLNILRTTAENAYTKGEQFGDKKFLMAFADALEIANKPGEYVPMSKR